jgi:hypothetical protein
MLHRFVPVFLTVALCASAAPVTPPSAIFNAPQAFAQQANGLTVGDFNGDGKPDLVTVDGSTVTIRLGNGDGTFEAPVRYKAGGGDALAVVAADFDGDGKLDLAVGQRSRVAILLGRGDGTFGSPVSYAVGVAVLDIAVGDFNGDGAADLVVPGTHGGASILWGNGNGTFQRAKTYL